MYEYDMTSKIDHEGTAIVKPWPEMFLDSCNILRLYKIKCTIEATSTLLNTYPMSLKNPRIHFWI